MPYWQAKLLKMTMAGREIRGFAPYPTWPSAVISMALMAMSAMSGKERQLVRSVDAVNYLRIPLNYHTAIPIEASILFMAGRQV